MNERKRYSINKEGTILTIYSLRLAGWLMWHSSVLGGMAPDKNGSGKNVFFFRATQRNLELIDRYYEKIEG